MLALKGIYNGKSFVAVEKYEKVNIRPFQKVIITVLDEIEEVEPDEFDLQLIKDSEKDNDETYTLDECLRGMGLNHNDL